MVSFLRVWGVVGESRGQGLQEVLCICFPLRPTGGGEHEERAEDVNSCQQARDHLVAYHLAPAITAFVLDEDWKCCNNELEQTLTLLHSEWRKKIEPSRQKSTQYLIIVSNLIDSKGSEFVETCMRWETHSMPTAAYDFRLLPEQETSIACQFRKDLVPGPRDFSRWCCQNLRYVASM